MEFRGIQLDLMEQVRAATFELGVGKFPGLVPIGGRDLVNGGRRRKYVDKQLGGKKRQTHPINDLETVHI
jgi:hypothetical protein